MAPSQKKTKSSKKSTKVNPKLAQSLLEHALSLLHTGEAEEALPVAVKALSSLPENDASQLPALELLGEIHIELGDPDEARKYFLKAAQLDPDAAVPLVDGGGADKFLWLAQLSEDGGADSVGWFEKGATVLRREIAVHQDSVHTEEDEILLDLEKRKLANALCGAAEVYMTDLSWEDDAEARCEALVTEACMVAPDSPEPLQTLASVRISQTRLDDARAALLRSLEMWEGLPPEDPEIPDFPTRVSLVRLLMEAELEERAMDVLERLIQEDDSSVEAWYLGGWCLHLLAKKPAMDADDKGLENDTSAEVAERPELASSRKWLRTALKLYDKLEYEDDRLKEHAEELVAELNKVLDEPVDAEEEEEEWEDQQEDDEDEEMRDS